MRILHVGNRGNEAMSDPYIGEIRMFAGNFAPAGWNLCDGSLLAISDYDTLFNLIGTTYGGDGQTTFKVPDLRGRVPVHQGNGAGSTYVMGQIGGTEQVTLTSQQLPSHNHLLQAANVPGDTGTPQTGQALSSQGPAGSTPPAWLPFNGTNQVPLSGASIGSSGSSRPHGNIQPTVVVNFIISLFGIYPSQA
jgi:microcystin-dependent protein